MTDEIIKQVDSNALKALKAAASENDHVKQAVKTGTALKLVGESAKLEKMKTDKEMADRQQNLEEEKFKAQKALDEEKLKLQRDLEEQKRIDMIHQREAQEAIEEANRVSQERQLAMRLMTDGIIGAAHVLGGFALVNYGVNLEKTEVVAGKFIDFAIRSFPNPFKK